MKRLIIHLWVNGVHPVMLSLDDYFKNRDEMEGESWENLKRQWIFPFEKNSDKSFGRERGSVATIQFYYREKECMTNLSDSERTSLF